MKRYRSLLLSALLLVSLCACGQKDVTPQEPETPDTPETQDNGPEASAVLTPVTSEDEVRALYTEEIMDTAVLLITEYEGDYLVQCGSAPNAEWLDWVYGQSGIRRRMLWLDAELLELEIEASACIRAVVGGPNIYNGVPGFPRVHRVSLNLLYDELGQALDYDPYSSGSNAESTEVYWANAGERWDMGMADRREAIRSAQIDAGGVSVAFAPLADGSDFTAAYCEIPLTTVALSDDNSTLTITMHDTYLDSGELNKDTDSPDFLYYLADYGSLYPDDFPEGALTGSCFLIQSAELHQEGDNAVLTVRLNTDYLTDNPFGDDAYFQFNGSTGYTGVADCGPYLRIQLRATTELFDD